jgi:hypothetical protein
MWKTIFKYFVNLINMDPVFVREVKATIYHHELR